jgi:undecaprenyl-diphosphatase
LPFRGFSRSGATISTGMLSGATRANAERFSFALAVILTPPVVLREVARLHAVQQTTGAQLHSAWEMSLLGCVLAFLAGLFALRWLSRWLEQGRWYLFGIYCIVASLVVFGLFKAGY